jgi:hypothetical protein
MKLMGVHLIYEEQQQIVFVCFVHDSFYIKYILLIAWSTALQLK